MNTEALRALEKKWRDIGVELHEKAKRPYADESDKMHNLCEGDLAHQFAHELKAILATASEQAPVAMPLTDDEHEWLMYAVDHMLDDSEPEDKTCARVMQGLLDRCVVTSPAHTSEARDAARYRWMRRGLANTKLLPDGVADLFANALDQNDATKFDAAIDAAMRQEAGKP